jgi:serine phosphatase RsbU (regulator of sigma subunit)
VGAIALLGVTLFSISYSLIQHEKRIFKSEIEKSIVFQGRNFALSSEKSLLRSDPEFELYPFVNRILSSSTNITSVIITDSNGYIQGDKELKNISKPLQFDYAHHYTVQSSILGEQETLSQDRDTYVFKTPVKSSDKHIGYVYLVYSKHELHSLIRRAMIITLVCGVVAFVLGIVLALVLFRRISQPMDVLMEGVNTIAEGDLEARIELSTRNEFSVLADSFNNMASRISAAQEELIMKERMERELEIAHDIQSTLIPSVIHEPPGFNVGTYYKSATEVGGDYLDIIPIDSDNIAFIMADVSGKGVPGLVVMAMLKVIAQDLAKKGISPKEVVRQLNTTISENIQETMFVTLFFAVLNSDTGKLSFSNAGHNPLLVYNQDNQTSLYYKMKGPPLGVYTDEEFVELIEQYELSIKPGDLVLQYTDGLNESQKEDGVQFSLDRMATICNECAGSGARALVERLVEAEVAFRGESAQTDDITLLALSASAAERVEHTTH